MGNNNPLRIQGSFGSTDNAPLVLRNSLSSGHGLIVASAGNTGVSIASAGNDGMAVGFPGGDGYSVLSAGAHGLNVAGAGGNGVHIGAVVNSGVSIDWAQGDGIFICRAGVGSRMALTPLPDGDGDQVVRSLEGAAAPGDYVAVTVLGVAQVKVQAGEAIQPGQRLTVADSPGRARAVRTVQVEGVRVDESGPTLGVALEPAADGLVWVLVNPQ